MGLTRDYQDIINDFDAEIKEKHRYEPFKTIDELVDYVNHYGIKMAGIKDDPISYIIFEQDAILLRILRSKSNLPSKYDLEIIRAATKLYLSKSVLTIYKNRKET